MDRTYSSMDIEIWADSFHEGEWALSMILKSLGVDPKLDYVLGFIPMATMEIDGILVRMIVFGAYKSWAALPSRVRDLLAWGKPDFVAYSQNNDSILFAVEETAATPTGNQPTQRCERMYGAARKRIPFWYLVSEYGVHLDGGTRRDSIWPTLAAAKLAHAFHTPCAVLHYSEADSPENYEAGTGTETLFQSLALIILNHVRGADPLTDLEGPLTSQFEGMLAFVKNQANEQVSYLAPTGFESDRAAAEYLAKTSVHDGTERAAGFMHWPIVSGLPSSIRGLQRASTLIKNDPLLPKIEQLVAQGKAYVLSNNTGSRPQPRGSLIDWITRQRLLHDSGPTLTIPASFSLDIDDFPVTETGLHHVTTAKNIFYLIDRWADLRSQLESAYPRLENRIKDLGDESPCLLYVSNSVLPGRIFGDPFTGQIAAYATVFDKLASNPRKVIAYFPHQSYGVVNDPANLDNKGKTMMSELVDLLVFHSGVGLDLAGNQWI